MTALFWSAQGSRLGEQLDRDGPRQRLLPDDALLSPKAGLFDGTWKLPDIELMK